VSGDEISPPPPGTWETVCSEAVKDDGTSVTAADYHVVFYTIAEDKQVVNLLVAVGGFPSITCLYDCATGELVEEKRTDGTETLVWDSLSAALAVLPFWRAMKQSLW